MRDADVRGALREQLAHTHASDPGTTIVEEMGVWSGSARIDLAVINGELCGYEIKSDRDTLERLPFQSIIYSYVFDRVVLVVGRKHAEKAVKIVPEWWGVTIATSRQNQISLEFDRGPDLNPAPDPEIIAQMLWKEEALSVLDRWGLARGWRSRRVKEIHHRLAHELPFDDLRCEVRSRLKERSGWLRQVGPNTLDVSANPDLHPVL